MSEIIPDAPRLAEWLLERIADRERAANLAYADSGWAVEGKKIASPREVVAKVVDDRTARFIVDNSPKRVLARCEADRRIVALHAPDDDEGFHICHDSLADDSDCGELRALASVYADAPGWREEWR